MPLDLPRFGVRLSQSLGPRRSLELAAAAEANGFASLWFAENPFHRGLMPVAGACAAMTERIGIGLGIVNFYQHHPTLIAAEFAALDELAGGLDSDFELLDGVRLKCHPQKRLPQQPD